ncbi:outer membrane protein assembly factor BamB [Aliidiomarina iranensis]|uniref:Outer membrane protein assembly factor BamB n=1 Tax=Aliidiomarina iranensis TaxID=1434071 RepID=A0A432W306_9GAMM|nr:outer membrane protein assembly factor BamB [Aliidiomarina iranensis]RUO23622.1 outer membrane protein assembly factor BamB [Aliidiomarina iranensis]
MMVLKRWLGAFAAVAFLAACSSTEGPTYADLTEITPEVSGSIVWQSKVGSGSEGHYSRLVPAIQDDVIYAADRHGLVVAMNLENGNQLWSQRLGGRPGFLNRYLRGESARISGITAAGSMLFIGSENGVITALNSDNGELIWEQKVPGEVLSAPTVGEGRVVAQLSSGYVVALAARTGEMQWSHEEEVSLLSLRGVSQPAIESGGVIFGTATGKAVVLLGETGQLAWEERLATPSGATELERLVDVDGSPLIIGGTFFMSAFNGELVGLELRSGEPIWKQDHGAWRSPVQAGTRIVLVNQDSHLLGIDRRNGIELWRNSDLFNRSLTEPAVLGTYLVAGDRFGYLHWFNRNDGRLVGRLELEEDVAIQGAIQVAGENLVVQDASGSIYVISQQAR